MAARRRVVRSRAGDAAARAASLVRALGRARGHPGRSARAARITRRQRGFLEPPALLEPGAEVGAYRIERILGRGGMGVVYLAHDTRLHRRVALKSLPPHLFRDDRMRARLRQEARAAAALSHPSIATVYALEEIGDQMFIASRVSRGPHAARRDRGRPRRPGARGRDRAPTIAAALPPRTSAASCIAISSPRTSSSPRTAA